MTICLLPQKSQGTSGFCYFYKLYYYSTVLLLKHCFTTTFLSFLLFYYLSYSQKKPQKVSLLFEDEVDDFNGSLFGTKPAANTSTAVAPANVSSQISDSSTLYFASSQRSLMVRSAITLKSDFPSSQPTMLLETPPWSESVVSESGRNLDNPEFTARHHLFASWSIFCVV